MSPESPKEKQHLLSLIWPFIGIALFQALLLLISLNVLSSVRAYVNGESLWSKGYKDAIFFLGLYVDKPDEIYLKQYQQAIASPLNFQHAKSALESPVFDPHAAQKSLVAGGIDPQDAPGMVTLYRNFSRFGFMSSSITIWNEADAFLVEIEQLASTIEQTVASGQVDDQQIANWKAQIYKLNRNATPLTEQFSVELGRSSRSLNEVLIWLNLSIAAALILLALSRTAKLMRQRSEFEDALATEKERVQITLASIGDAVLTIDDAGKIDYMNPAAEQLTGWRGANASGLALDKLLPDAGTQSVAPATAILEQMSSDNNETAAHKLMRADGSAVVVTLMAAPIRNQDKISGMVLVLHDMTREHQYIANLSWQASHDALTGLLNRREFDRRLSRSLENLQQQQSEHALMYLDLDQFKIINDTCGHAAGDQLLRQVCTALQSCLRENDTLARLGGDEFGVLLENCPADISTKLAEQLRLAVQALRFSWNGRSFNVSASIGLVTLGQSQVTLEESLRAADVACYMAKDKGRNRVQLYHPENTELSLRFGEMAWAQRIHQALKEHRFELYAQEIMPAQKDLDGGIHIELLLRLRDEDNQLVAPGHFMPAAERYGLMPMLDHWVVENALCIIIERKNAGLEPIQTCAINLSGSTIGDPEFLAFLRQQLKRPGIDPRQICFEITETSAIANLTDAMHFIKELQVLGCKFSLDDFGVGMSSFAYLKNLPVDYLKIDGGFVKDMLSDPIDRAMVEMINRIAQVMGKATIAEFVENEQIRQELEEIGVDYVQGYGIAKPHPFNKESTLVSGAAFANRKRTVQPSH
ncbi:PAS domain S-box protein [Pseudomonas sp. J237]|nr:MULTISPECIES: EAL domain-containing protein [Pseudomonas]OEO24085.1 PAS domain S-box protein [Pseudomonas sp. J237]